MKKVLLFLAFTVVTYSLTAQTRDSEFFTKVQKLLSKAEGKKFMGLMGDDKKVGEQLFTYDAVSITEKGLGKYSSDWVTEYSKINWSSVRYYYGGVRGNDDLKEFHLRFKSNFEKRYFVKEKRDNDVSQYNEMTIYVLAKHIDELKALFDAQYK